MAHVVVVGSGAAGLTAALTASQWHSVTLVTKRELGDGNSRLAQGGIAAVTSSDDSTELHAADTIAAGAGWSDADVVRILCTEGPERVRDLVALGMPFDRAGDDSDDTEHADDTPRPAPGGGLARAMEAAHSVPRVLHAGGAATGHALVATLLAAVRAAPVTVIEHAFLIDLEVSDAPERRVTAVELMHEGQRLRVEADAVVIATGGTGSLYRYSTNPDAATGDGIAAAHRAGAELADMEFVQFHPTALAVPGTPLISEAVRGEGAELVDDRGIRFMRTVHPLADLAPRDVVARAIADRQLAQAGRPVLLDSTRIGAATLERRFPDLTRLCRQHGFDWAREPIPVTPAAHYLMGGISVDDRGRSDLYGLFAVGEAACTGAHGANRLASNSLLEAMVFAHRAAESIALPWPIEMDPEAAARRSPQPPAPAVDSEPATREQLQELMWRYAGLLRDADGLAIAESQLARWHGAHATEYERETANLLELARVVVAAAQRRQQSLGAHHRTDSAGDLSPDAAAHESAAAAVGAAAADATSARRSDLSATSPAREAIPA